VIVVAYSAAAGTLQRRQKEEQRLEPDTRVGLNGGNRAG